MTSYKNPVIPGYNPDPSCISVPELGLFVCMTSTFMTFPGIPIYVSRDLINWKLVGHVFNRPEQLPDFNDAKDPTWGIYAPTIRYHDGTFYVATFSISFKRHKGLLFTSKDIFDPNAWSNALPFPCKAVDPDLFWDTDGQLWTATAAGMNPADFGVYQAKMDAEKLETGSFDKLWEGAGGSYPEAPHIFLKDGWYYLLVAEGGTEIGHAATVARSRTITGPYESCPHNPVLSNAGTDEYFQSVGHADFFQDFDGNWWGVALARRSGKAYKHFPMARETVLFPMKWEEGEWPVCTPVKGEMQGPLPKASRAIAQPGIWIDEDDDITFGTTGDALPLHFCHYGLQESGRYALSHGDSPSGSLRVSPSAANTTYGLSFIGRRQTSTHFTFEVEMQYTPSDVDDEAGLSVFTDHLNRIDLGVVHIDSKPCIRLRAHSGNEHTKAPDATVREIDSSALSQPFSLRAQATSATCFEFSYRFSGESDWTDIGSADSALVSRDFIGAFLGVYASGTRSLYVLRWRYTNDGQVRA